MALYSGLGAGLVAMAILAAAVMLYRKNQSEYGADAVDSAALAGGFQSFNFKTTRQGETADGERHDDHRHGVSMAPARWSVSLLASSGALNQIRPTAGEENRRVLGCSRTGEAVSTVTETTFRSVGVVIHAGGN